MSRTLVRLAAGALVGAAFAACGGGTGVIACARDPVTTEEGVKALDPTCGKGEEAARGDLMAVSYRASVEGEGVIEDVQKPFEFRLGMGQVIEGWDVGLLGMQVGGTRRLTIPPDAGYGDFGLAPDIPPGATLVYDVTLLSRKEAD